ncbi:hypothetical protein D9619_011162 [Psilocybe cf. subviscida]|uniref:Endonuclease/exonuclease/phosphatase domain-containing protein n=1 Tax=Psilocybe cf. subviscida TaxID=2480587 RepID=A0A8H5F5D3_9AGAR|nr:hypothetical protein D9619_011162 [Psilocybe cf. subviscida]
MVTTNIVIFEHQKQQLGAPSASLVSLLLSPDIGNTIPARIEPQQQQQETTQAQPLPKTGKTVRANLKLATQNLRGTKTRHKWKDVNTCFKRNAIGLAAVQETHYLDEDDIKKINDTPGYRIHLFHSGNPDKPNCAGVGIVLNKYLTKWQDAHAESLIPGRAMRMTLPWQENASLHVLAVYAPNSTSENAMFWKDLRTIWTDRNLPKPDILLGDFNLTESPIDREPAHFTYTDANNELDELKTTLGVVDAWRLDFPSREEFTWEKPVKRDVKSRIDRIYLLYALHPLAFEWDISQTEVKTDHKMVSTRITTENSPEIGKGRWCIPPALLKDKSFVDHITKSGIALNQAISKATQQKDTPGTDPTLIQSIYAKWKHELLSYARNVARAKMPRIDARIVQLKSEITTIQRRSDIPLDQKMIEKCIIEQEITDLIAIRVKLSRDYMDVTGWINRETIRKPWINENKEKKPRDTFYRLKVPESNPLTYVTSTKEMAELATEHHVNLQSLELPDDNDENSCNTEEVLSSLSSFLTEEQTISLDNTFDDEDIESSIHHLPPGTAPGLDGLPHELWKSVLDRHLTLSKAGKETFDPIYTLRVVFNNIIEFGTNPNSGFAEGWMCPLYKKNDRTDIANYRPITVLNADYKLFTRILSVRAPIRLGGRKLIDLKSRNDAIELRKYQRYCATNPNERPKWAFVADEILKPHIEIYNNVQDNESIILPPLQKFDIHTKSRLAPLPAPLCRMLQTKDTYNTVFNPPCIPEELKLQLPLWYHPGNDANNPDYIKSLQLEMLLNSIGVLYNPTIQQEEIANVPPARKT